MSGGHCDYAYERVRDLADDIYGDVQKHGKAFTDDYGETLDKMNSENGFIGCFGLIIALIILGAIGFAWYHAGLQTEVYRRQGIEMTRWEVFIGCTPTERQIHFEKPSDQKELEKHDTR